MTGYLGTRQMRADCPECGRDTAGGWAGDAEHRYIILHPHKRFRVTHESSRAALVRERCPASGTTVEAQRRGLGR